MFFTIFKIRTARSFRERGICGAGPAGTVRVYQPEGSTPAWCAMYDDRRHMVVAVNFNTDVGDAWSTRIRRFTRPR